MAKLGNVGVGRCRIRHSLDAARVSQLDLVELTDLVSGLCSSVAQHKTRETVLAKM